MISQKTDGGHISEDRFPVEGIPGHPLLFVHSTVIQAANECSVTQFRDSIKHDISTHDKPTLVVQRNKNIRLTTSLESRRIGRNSPTAGRDVKSRGRHRELERVPNLEGQVEVGNTTVR